MLPWSRRTTSGHTTSGHTTSRPRRPRPSTARALRPFAAALLLAAAALAPASSAQAQPAGSGTGAAASAAESSSGWNDYGCRPSAEHPRPVVLVHGTFGNSVDNWLGLAPYLVARGYCVFSLDYGQLPGVPIFHGLGPVDESAGQLDTFVDKVLAATGTGEVDLVGHSQGGMMPRHYLKFLGGAEKVNALVGLAPDNHGTDLNGLTKLLEHFPGAADLVDENTPGLADQIAGSPFLTKLNEGGDTVPGVRYTVIATRYDQVVTPYASQFLEGPDVRNVLIQDKCAADLSEHVAIGLADRIAFHEVANALDPAHAKPTTCASAVS
ncbi:esterase/lipase family protein [Streptomyces boluensis]|uniref:Alpha/beta fold hydrolase n=1 Tax=Streptomyces boluensis TaxID=1775135 RepID=A0A964UKN9_9ACTN|nr:alpha/beta fold hydrolase [Streptomyces boluensis]NBE50973.1 alpha/beta fold hydrolase [Streptomyces boluensis]